MPPKVPTVDQVLFVLMQHPRRWFMLVETPDDRSSWGALAVALHRRGCEVHKLLGTMRVRWTHTTPSMDSLITVIRPVLDDRKLAS